jgi:Uncharacterized protein conserved in bacteria
MRKITLFLSFVVCIQFLQAQRSFSFISEDRLFFEGKSMYDDKNYAGCINTLGEYKKIARNPDLIQEAEFLMLSSSFRQGKDITLGLKHFWDTYPETRHIDDICFMIGSRHFAAADYNVAVFWLSKANIDNLSIQDQEDYAYRMAFSSLRTKNTEEAYRLFGLLKDEPGKYREAATYYYAFLLYADGVYDQSLIYLNLLRDHPSYGLEVGFYITQINFMQKRYAQTIREGKELLAEHPNHPNNDELYRLIGSSYYFEGDYENAVKYLNLYMEEAPSPSKNDLYLLGISYYNLRNYREAVTYLNKCVEGNDGITQNAYLHLGQSYLELGDEAAALMAFESASRSSFDPEVTEVAMYNYALLLHKTSSSAFGESVTVLENFLNDYPDSRYLDKISDCLVEVYLTTKNYETALESINKIHNPGHKILEAKQQIYYYLGTVRFTNTEFEEAVDFFTKAMDAGNHAPESKERAVYWRGESYYRLGRYDLAIRDYTHFLQNSSRAGDLIPSSYYGLGYCYFKQQQYNKARADFSIYVSKETDQSKVTLADAYARLGDCYFYDRRFADAENAYARSASLQPQMSDYTIYQQGFVMGLQKDYRGKIAQMDRLIKLFPDSRYVPDALYEKGRSYVMMDNSAEAIKTYEGLLTKYPENAYARKAGIQIGLLYFNINEPQKAATAYKRVIDKYPGSEEAKMAVQDLKSVYVELNDVAGYAQYVNSLGGASKFDISEQDSLTYIAAERFFIRNEVNQAQDALKKYLQSFPNGAFKVNAHYYLGNIYYNKNQYELAEAEFNEVLQAGDSKFTEETLVHLSDMEFKSGDYENAFRLYRRLETVARSKENKDNALLGAMRSGARLNRHMEIINAANSLLKESKIEPEKSTEALYYRAKAYLNLKEREKALADLKTLSKDTRTVFGAEAKYLLAQYYLDNKEVKNAETEVMDYIKKGTPHAYWLARSFIVLSDVYISRKEYIQARQYLESLQHNYANKEDDIHTRISEKMERIDQLQKTN